MSKLALSLKIIDNFYYRRSEKGSEDSVEGETQTGVCTYELVAVHCSCSADGMRGGSHRQTKSHRIMYMSHRKRLETDDSTDESRNHHNGSRE